MSKKHFIALADKLRAMKPELPADDGIARTVAIGRLEQWESTVQGMADYCEAQSPAFMRDQWIGYVMGDNGSNGKRAFKLGAN